MSSFLYSYINTGVMDHSDYSAHLNVGLLPFSDEFSHSVSADEIELAIARERGPGIISLWQEVDGCLPIASDA